MNEKKFEEKERYILSYADIQEWAEDEIERKLTEEEFEKLIDQIITTGIFCEFEAQIIEIILEITKKK